MKWLLFAALFGAPFGLALAADSAPAWVTEIAKRPLKTYPPKVSVGVLLAEEQLTVDDAGRRSMRERGAVRIVSSKGSSVRAYRSYNAKSGKIRSFQAWLIRPGGEAQAYGKDQVMDIALSRDAAYDESRAKFIECDRSAKEGSVFAWEIVEDESTIFTTYPFSFQESAPVDVSRFILNLSSGWEANWTVLNHDRKDPVVSGNSYTWELRDLPWIEEEDYSVGWHALAPRLGVSYWPREGRAGALKPLNNWESVSSWMTHFSEPAVEVTPAIQTKARALTESVSSEWERIRAIAEFTQKVNYVSVSLNVNRGGGYTPNAAGRTLERNYGDCKDKVTLMRSLLKAAGIESYSVAVYSGSRAFVRRDWPSPQQFNHVVTAVKVGAAVTAPTVVEHAGKGRLLIFDVTDSITPLGDLSEDEQGSLGMLVAESGGGLLQLPLLGISASRIDRRAEAEVSINGAAIAVMRSIYYGQAAVPWKGVETHLGADEVKKRWERILTRRSGGVIVSDVKSESKDGSYTATVQFSINQLGKLMQDRLLILTPGSLTPETVYHFSGKERREPIELRASARTDSVVIKAPEGFVVDEIPEDVNRSGPFGSYQAAWRVDGRMVNFVQKLDVNDAIVPAKDYALVKAFFDEVTNSNGQPVILVKK